MRSRLPAFTLFLLTTMGLCGCVSYKAVRREASESPVLEALLSQGEGQVRVRAGEAYFDGVRLLVKYTLGDLTCYGQGRWDHADDRVVLSRMKTATTLGGVALPLEEHSTRPWDSIPESADPVFVLQQEVWDGLMDQVLEAILPEDPLKGVLVDAFNRQYFLYYDEDLRVRISDLAGKPARIGVERLWSFSQLVDLSLSMLEEDLLRQGIEDRQVLVNTGDSGLYTYPFIYVDIQSKLVLFVQITPASRMEWRLATYQDAQLLSHVLGSHAAIVLRPVTSIGRLIYNLLDLGWDLLESGGDLIETTLGIMFAGGDTKPPPPVSAGPGMDLAEFEERLDQITNSRTNYGTMEYLVDGEEFFPELIDALSAARRSVHIRSYIFDNDDYAITIADILKERSRELDVKVLLDGFGTIIATKVQAQTLPRDHEPPVSVKSYLKQGSRVKVHLQTNPWLTLDHTKLIVMDGKTAYVGGMNIGRDYRYERHDIMVRLRGSVVRELQQEFDRSWAHAGVLGDLALFAKALETKRRVDREEGEYPIRVLYSKAGEPEIYRTQLEAIRRAREYIYLENMYFTQDRILEELIKARRRGVDVRVIMPLGGYMGPFDRANAVAANGLLASGVRVYIYSGMLHAKAAVYDGWACLGSANFDKASFKRNREINVATSHPEAVQDLVERLFEPDFEASYELKEPIREGWTDRIMELLTDQL